MKEVEFIYEGKSTIIQCNFKDKMKDICTKFTSKTSLDINNLFFLYNGKTINLESYFEQINESNNKIKILVYNSTQQLFLKFNLNNYNIILTFSKNFDIKAEYGESLNKKIYNGTFSLEELQKKSNFFKMFDSIEDSYNDIKLLLNQKSFYIQAYEKSIAFCIKQQIGIQYDIIFPLKEDSVDIKEIIAELCEKNNKFENKINILTEKNINLENKINEINKKIDNLEKQIKNIVSNIDKELKENTSNNDGLTNEERNRIKSLFDEKELIKINLLYSGLDREEFFKKCEGKNNLLFLVNDVRGEKYGGFMSSELIKNEKGKCMI